MKKLLIAALALCSFKTTDEKKLKVEMTLEQWAGHISRLNAIKKIADESNLPNQEVKFIVATIDSFEKVAIPQLNKTTVKGGTKKGPPYERANYR